MLTSGFLYLKAHALIVAAMCHKNMKECISQTFDLPKSYISPREPCSISTLRNIFDQIGISAQSLQWKRKRKGNSGTWMMAANFNQPWSPAPMSQVGWELNSGEK